MQKLIGIITDWKKLNQHSMDLEHQKSMLIPLKYNWKLKFKCYEYNIKYK